MSLRLISRLSLVLGTAMVIGAFITMAQPAQANERERVTIGQDERFTVEYDGFLASNPGTQVDEIVIDPTFCEKVPYCDAIPLTVLPPRTLDARTTEFYLNITLTWEPGAAAEVQANDLDLYVEPVSDDPNDARGSASSPTGAIPERVSIPGAQGDYVVIVNNFAGDGGPYEIEYEWSSLSIPTPFESLPPTFFGTPPAAATNATPVLPPAVGGTAPSFGAPSIELPDLSSSAPALPDAAFDAGFGDGASLDDQLVAPAEKPMFSPITNKADLGDPPSALTLLLWMVGLPLVLVGIGASILQRRRTTLLAI